MRMEWDGNKRAISCMSNVLVIASQEVMGGTIENSVMLSKSPLEVLLLPPHIVLKCLQVEFALKPSDEQKHKFPKLIYGAYAV